MACLEELACGDAGASVADTEVDLDEVEASDEGTRLSNRKSAQMHAQFAAAVIGKVRSVNA
jgi:hypothetical protein